MPTEEELRKTQGDGVNASVQCPKHPVPMRLFHCFRKIWDELQHPIDKHSKSIIAANI